jgi:hypothetical protein
MLWRHCEKPTGRPNARPMTGFREGAIHTCFVAAWIASFALAMTVLEFRVPGCLKTGSGSTSPRVREKKT